MIADLPRVQCLLTEVVADTAVQHLRTVAVVDARCRRMVVAAEAARLHMAVVEEVTHHLTVEVALVDILPAAEAGMPRLRAAVEATAAEAGPTAATTVGTDTTKF